MRNLLLRKTLRYGTALFCIVSLNFFIPRWMPGDPVAAMLGDGSYLSREDAAALRTLYGLDKPVLAQFALYWKWILRLDFGVSIARHVPVFKEVVLALKRTLSFSFPAILTGILLGMALGALAGWKSPTWWESLTTAGSLLLYSLPSYGLSILLLYVFCIKGRVFPLPGPGTGSGGVAGFIQRMALPFLAITLAAGSRHFLLMRGSVYMERSKQYPVSAFSRGLTSCQVLSRHVVRNASLPLVTLAALDLGLLVGGMLYVEMVFSLHGMGTLLYESILSRDYPMIQGVSFVLMITVTMLNFLVDLAYSLLDPRIREVP